MRLLPHLDKQSPAPSPIARQRRSRRRRERRRQARAKKPSSQPFVFSDASHVIDPLCWFLNRRTKSVRLRVRSSPCSLGGVEDRKYRRDPDISVIFAAQALSANPPRKREKGVRPLSVLYLQGSGNAVFGMGDEGDKVRRPGSVPRRSSGRRPILPAARSCRRSSSRPNPGTSACTGGNGSWST